MCALTRTGQMKRCEELDWGMSHQLERLEKLRTAVERRHAAQKRKGNIGRKIGRRWTMRGGRRVLTIESGFSV